MVHEVKRGRKLTDQTMSALRPQTVTAQPQKMPTQLYTEGPFLGFLGDTGAKWNLHVPGKSLTEGKKRENEPSSNAFTPEGQPGCE